MQGMKKKLRRFGIKKKLKKKSFDEIIERKIVDISAEENFIYITEEKIQNEIEKQRFAQGLSQKNFRNKVEREVGLPYNEWVNELRYKLIKRQIIQINLRVSPPTIAELKRFYYQNKKRIGIELRYREIRFVPKNRQITEEARVSRLANKTYQKLIHNPKKFRAIARTHAGRYDGILRPYESIYDIARENPLLASLLFQVPLQSISRPFRDSLGRYMIVRVEKRHPLPFSKAKNLILNRIYAEKEEKVFSKWLKNKKKNIPLRKIKKISSLL